MTETKRVLITVKTYPLPSDKYLELVCTAGMLEDGSFIRLYPIDYRYRPYWQWYKKYQWIEIEVEKHDKDRRKESYRPRIESIKTLSSPLDTKNCWADRRAVVLRQPSTSIEELKERQKADGTSFGVVKPKEVTDLIIEPDDDKWKPAWEADIAQLRMFGPERKPLEKIPYKFKYRFTCDDPRCKGHQMMVEDWEVGALYRNVLSSCGDPERAAQSVRDRFLTTLCGPNIDTHFFVGTVLKYGTWIILGVFWPPMIPQAPAQPTQAPLFTF